MWVENDALDVLKVSRVEERAGVCTDSRDARFVLS